MGYVTWPRPFHWRFIIHRLGHAMFHPHISDPPVTEKRQPVQL